MEKIDWRIMERQRKEWRGRLPDEYKNIPLFLLLCVYNRKKLEDLVVIVVTNNQGRRQDACASMPNSVTLTVPSSSSAAAVPTITTPTTSAASPGNPTSNNLSASGPTTPSTAAPPSPLPHSRLARSHNRRFHVRFPGVHSEEHLLNYYSCALVADILLQGHLYITENYFAFYSNIFGRKTQILIPVCDVIKVTKERTAKIIPNAVGLYTEEGKYVFGSLLSRNTTYRLMHHVWLKSADPDSSEETPSENSEPGTSDEPVPPPPSPMPTIEVADDTMDIELAAAVRRLSRRKSEMFPRISAKAVRRGQGPPSSSSVAESVVDQITLSECHWDCAKAKDCFCQPVDTAHEEKNSLSKTTLVLLAATLLLILLFFFATILVYRVSIIHGKGSSVEENWPPRTPQRLSNYLELLKKQQDAVEDEIQRITRTLKIRMDELGQVRQSIDKLMGITAGGSCHTSRDTAEAMEDFAKTA